MNFSLSLENAKCDNCSKKATYIFFLINFFIFKQRFFCESCNRINSKEVF